MLDESLSRSYAELGEQANRIAELTIKNEELYKELWEKSSRAIAKDKYIKKLNSIVNELKEENEELKKYISIQKGIIGREKLNTLYRHNFLKTKYEQISDLLGDLYESKQTEEHLRAILDMEASIREMNQKIINKLIK